MRPQLGRQPSKMSSYKCEFSFSGKQSPRWRIPSWFTREGQGSEYVRSAGSHRRYPQRSQRIRKGDWWFSPLAYVFLHDKDLHTKPPGLFQNEGFRTYFLRERIHYQWSSSEIRGSLVSEPKHRDCRSKSCLGIGLGTSFKLKGVSESVSEPKLWNSKSRYRNRNRATLQAAWKPPKKYFFTVKNCLFSRNRNRNAETLGSHPGIGLGIDV